MWWRRDGHLTVQHNELQFAGESVPELVETHGTPVYLYDLDRLRTQFERLEAALDASGLPNPAVRYAMKANNVEQVLDAVRACGGGIDATSPGEAKLASDRGFDADDIVFTGTSLSDSDLRFLADRDMLVNFDSVADLRRFDAGAGRRVGLRINSRVGLGRSKKTTTGGTEAEGDTGDGDGLPVKFGIPADEAHVSAALSAVDEAGFELDCLHHHVGSGWLSAQAINEEHPDYLDALDTLLSVAETIEARGHDLSTLDLGGGYGVPHRRDETPIDLDRFFGAVADRIDRSPVSFDRVFVEPGTFLVSDCGIFVTRVTKVETKGGRTFVGVDGGLNNFNSPAHYDYYHHLVDADRVVDPEQEMCITVAGNNCESGDLFAVDRDVPTRIETGDALAFLNAGAYGTVFQSDFNLRETAADIVVR